MSDRRASQHRFDSEPVPVDPIMASPGFFKTRLVKNGAWVPARLWTVEERDPETGDLIADVKYFAEIDGKSTDATAPRNWPWTKIPEAEFRFMTDTAKWARTYAPHLPAANPDVPVNTLPRSLF